MSNSNEYVVFTLDNQRYALNLSAEKRVIRMVEVSPLPKAPDIILGVVNMHGQILPVINIRKLFSLQERDVNPDDQLIIAECSDLHVALQADNVSDVIECDKDDVVSPADIFPDIEYIKGVVKLGDGMVFIYDIDRFLSLGKEKTITERLSDFIHISPPLSERD